MKNVIEQCSQQTAPSSLKIDMPRTDTSVGESISSKLDVVDFIPPMNFRKRKHCRHMTKNITLEDILSSRSRSKIKYAQASLTILSNDIK